MDAPSRFARRTRPTDWLSSLVLAVPVVCCALRNGGEGGIPIRTRMTQFLIFGMVANDWIERVAVVHPFKLNDHVLRRKTKALKFKIVRRKRLLETALDWQAKKAANPHIQAVDIAEATGLSPCRARQILRFARLQPEIQAAILQLCPQKAKKRFPERLLRQWIPLPRSEQLSQFKNYMP